MRPRRFRGRSLAELRERAAQAATALLERGGLVDSRELSSARVAAHLAGVNGHDPCLVQASLFPSLEDRAATLDAIRRLSPDADVSLRRRADAALEGRFELLGLREVSFGNPPDWRLDPIRGVRAPDVHWSVIRYLDPAVVGDHKLVWELSRHRHVLELAQAAWVTGESRYVDGCARALDSWMDSNPPKRGIHWASSLEVALRAIAWLWVLALLGPRLSGHLRQRMLGFLIVSGRHVERYLSTYFSPNTHLTGEALGLFYLGTMLPQARHAARWQARGAAILHAWVERHVRPDGVYVEQSTWYHRYTADIYLHYLLLARRAGIEVPPAVPARLERMMEHLMFVARPDGRIPLIGDDDGGRLLFLDDRTAHDVRTPLAVGAVVFRRSDFAHVARAPGAELVWLLGPRRRCPVGRSAARGPGGGVAGVPGWRHLRTAGPLGCGRERGSGGCRATRLLERGARACRRARDRSDRSRHAPVR